MAIPSDIWICRIRQSFRFVGTSRGHVVQTRTTKAGCPGVCPDRLRISRWMETPHLWATCAHSIKKKKIPSAQCNFTYFNLCFLLLVSSVDTTERSPGWTLSTLIQPQYQTPYSQPLPIWLILQSLTMLVALHWTAVKSFLSWGPQKQAQHQRCFSAMLSGSLPSTCWQLPSSSSPRYYWSFLPCGCNES